MNEYLTDDILEALQGAPEWALREALEHAQEVAEGVQQ